MNPSLTETLKTLCLLPGVSSWEDAVRDYIRTQAEPYTERIRTDAMGNLIVHRKGAKSAPGKLMLCAHMDEVGLIVKSISEDGGLHFGCVGGIDRRILLGKKVVVGDRRIPGVIGRKAVHLMEDGEEKSVPKLSSLYIDFGARSREEALQQVHLGDQGVFVSDAVEFGNHMLKAKAIDDRIGCAVLVQLLQEELPMDVTFVFTAQEETGCRGAFAAAFSETPEIAVVFEGTTAADTPAVAESKQVCWPGKGPVLSWMDNGTIYDRALFQRLRDLADQNHIPWQMKHAVAGGTDARSIQRTKAGVRVAGISAAVRYLHAPNSVCSLDDAEHILQLARLFLQAMAAAE